MVKSTQISLIEAPSFNRLDPRIPAGSSSGRGASSGAKSESFTKWTLMATEPLNTRSPKITATIPARTSRYLGGLEAVRLRPAMYIGSTGEMGLHHLVYEWWTTRWTRRWPVTAKNRFVIIHVDNSITVVDDGRGIPVDMMDLADGKVLRPCRWCSPCSTPAESSTHPPTKSPAACTAWASVASMRSRRNSTWKSGATGTHGRWTSVAASLSANLRQRAPQETRNQNSFLPDKSIFYRHRVQLRHTGSEIARDGLSQQSLEITLTDEAHRRPQDRQRAPLTNSNTRRHRRVRQAPQPRQDGTA